MTLITPPLKEDFAKVNGIRLHYVSQGKGPLALLLHGFPEFWYSWRHQLPFLADKYFAVAPDLRGYNLSDKPQGIAAYNIDTLTEDVKNLITFFGEKKATVIAHDWGGVIAWHLAAFFPEVVEKLVIMNAPHPRAFSREIKNNPKQRKASWYIYMFQIPWVPEWYVRRADFKMLDKIFTGWARRKEAFSEEDIRHFKTAMGQPGCLTAAINYYRAMMRGSKSSGSMKKYPLIKVPTLIFWGDEDLPFKRPSQILRDSISGAELITAHGAGHSPHEETPDFFNEILSSFLSEIKWD